MKTILVRVTREDIRKGDAAVKRKGNRSVTCPVARSIHSVPEFKKAIVWPSRVLLWLDRKSVRLPKNAKNFIARFDSGKPVKPFRFRLRVP